jgi:hypothetical protein
MNQSLTLALTPKELLSYIEFLRKELIRLGLEFGLDSDITIEVSQELDHFIFEYQRMSNT